MLFGFIKVAQVEAVFFRGRFMLALSKISVLMSGEHDEQVGTPSPIESMREWKRTLMLEWLANNPAQFTAPASETSSSNSVHNHQQHYSGIDYVKIFAKDDAIPPELIAEEDESSDAEESQHSLRSKEQTAENATGTSIAAMDAHIGTPIEAVASEFPQPPMDDSITQKHIKLDHPLITDNSGNSALPDAFADDEMGSPAPPPLSETSNSLPKAQPDQSTCNIDSNMEIDNNNDSITHQIQLDTTTDLRSESPTKLSHTQSHESPQKSQQSPCRVEAYNGTASQEDAQRIESISFPVCSPPDASSQGRRDNSPIPSLSTPKLMQCFPSDELAKTDLVGEVMTKEEDHLSSGADSTTHSENEFEVASEENVSLNVKHNHKKRRNSHIDEDLSDEPKPKRSKPSELPLKHRTESIKLRRASIKHVPDPALYKHDAEPQSFKESCPPPPPLDVPSPSHSHDEYNSLHDEQSSEDTTSRDHTPFGHQLQTEYPHVSDCDSSEEMPTIQPRLKQRKSQESRATSAATSSKSKTAPDTTSFLSAPHGKANPKKSLLQARFEVASFTLPGTPATSKATFGGLTALLRRKR